MVIKLNEWTPDTCDSPPCKVSIRFDTDQPGVAPEVVGYWNICTAHQDPDLPMGKLLWADGNWKDLEAYYAYQRSWFRWRGREQWEARRAVEPSIGPPPDTIASYTTEPPTPGSVAAPTASQLTARGRVNGWLNGHNARKNISMRAVEVEGPLAGVTWRWEGVGDARLLIVIAPNLTTQQRNRVQSACDIQFGPGKVSIRAA